MDNKVSSTNLGRISYSECLKIQRDLQDKFISGRDDSCGHVLFLEHEPVITVGKFGKEQNLVAGQQILKQSGIEIFETERGGDFTYHGPGQLVCYPVLNLKKLGIGVKKYVNLLEEVIIQSLSDYGIDAERKHRLPGVWIGDSKIAFIGIYVKKRVTMHGFSLNLQSQSEKFSHIVPCGISGLKVVSMSEVLSKNVDLQKTSRNIINNFEAVFGVKVNESDSILF